MNLEGWMIAELSLQDAKHVPVELDRAYLAIALEKRMRQGAEPGTELDDPAPESRGRIGDLLDCARLHQKVLRERAFG